MMWNPLGFYWDDSCTLVNSEKMGPEGRQNGLMTVSGATGLKEIKTVSRDQGLIPPSTKENTVNIFFRNLVKFAYKQ